MSGPGSESPLLDEQHAAFVQRGVMVSVASRNARNIASLVRALGCRVSADRRTVTVFVAASQAESLLSDLRDTAAIAVVASQPSTHRTIQIKGRDTVLARLGDGDLDHVAACVDSAVEDIRKLGYSEAQARTLLAYDPADLVAASFTPTEAFQQTPGPRAGTPLAR